MFVDRAVITVTAGNGGSGSNAFRRESGVPRGGPAGGDGGKGADVVVVADPQLGTLLDQRYRRHYRAEHGGHGGSNNCTGASGPELIIAVPPGTIIRDADGGDVLGELLEPGDRFVVAKGGRGGKGNSHFATSTNQAPRRWQPGEEGEERNLELELKLIADVGLVGQPNAGKSTLLAAISEARPRIADYPFTTLVPNLGVVSLPGYRSFIVADIPGIIEGAHEGKGLGHQFLRHIERTNTLLLLVPVDAADVQAEYEGLREELASYSEELARRPHCVVLTKQDILGPGEDIPSIDAPAAWGQFTISAVTGRGVRELLEGLWTHGVLREKPEVDEETEWMP